jgi:hypothetical protein
MTQQTQFRLVSIPRWLAVLIGVLALAFGVALVLLSITVALLMLPVIAIAGALYYLLGGRKRAPDTRTDTRVIDAEYRVIERERGRRES